MEKSTVIDVIESSIAASSLCRNLSTEHSQAKTTSS